MRVVLGKTIPTIVRSPDSLWYVSQYVFGSRHGGYSSGNVWNCKIPRNGMKMMDKENGILCHFVAQHKISIKLITLKIYATSYTRLDDGGTKPNQVSTTGAPHDLIWCFYTYYLVSPDHFNLNLFFIATYDTILWSSICLPYPNPSGGSGNPGQDSGHMTVRRWCRNDEYSIKQKF